MRTRSRKLRAFGALAIAGIAGALLITVAPSTAAGPMSGAIFTTNSTCAGTNINIFADKDNVYLDGGPAHPGAAGLPDGEYYVQVTAPDGTLLGTSVGAADETPAVVSGGEFAVCYRLSDIVIRASDSSPGYDDTPNPGGEYKVWVSSVSTFDPSSTKTDNFKAPDDPEEECTDPQDPTCFPEEPPQGRLLVNKFYDANANGLNDDGQPIVGWRVRIQDGIDYIRFTPVDITVAADDYVVTESDTVETNWVHTTLNPVNVTLDNGETETVEFGNLCLGAGGGRTLGFWSNKNGQRQITAPDLAMLSALNLRNANGSDFDPAAYSAFRTWILSATATNMAYMLSAQLAAMELNVFNGNVNGGSLIFAPGTGSANSLGFATVNAVMAEANTSLGTDGNTVASGPARTLQEALKNALDAANNNQNFVQATPCAFSFAG